MSGKVSPGCRRVTLDLPADLHARIKARADAPPALPFSEWCRRVLAHHADFPMPPLSERLARRIRLDGAPKRTGEGQE